MITIGRSCRLIVLLGVVLITLIVLVLWRIATLPLTTNVEVTATASRTALVERNSQAVSHRDGDPHQESEASSVWRSLFRSSKNAHDASRTSVSGTTGQDLEAFSVEGAGSADHSAENSPSEVNSLTDSSQSEWVEMLVSGSIPLTLEAGKKYRITTEKRGVANPRPLTSMELRRLEQIWEELADDSLSMDRRRQLKEEKRAIYSVNFRGSRTVRTVWIPLPGQQEPPDSEAILLDLGFVN